MPFARRSHVVRTEHVLERAFAELDAGAKCRGDWGYLY